MNKIQIVKKTLKKIT